MRSAKLKSVENSSKQNKMKQKNAIINHQAKRVDALDRAQNTKHRKKKKKTTTKIEKEENKTRTKGGLTGVITKTKPKPRQRQKQRQRKTKTTTVLFSIRLIRFNNYVCRFNS